MDPNVRCFGEYRCPKCNKCWNSWNSWPNCGQECKKCKTNVLAHKQRPLRASEKLHKDMYPTYIPHDQERCEKCKELGYSCC